MEENEYLRAFEAKLQNELLTLATSYRMLDGVLLDGDDIEARWEALALDYVADAVSQINEYPAVAVAWAGYLGAAVAHQWDDAWDEHSSDAYKDYYGANGFDDMDEHILFDIIGLSPESEDAKNFEELMRRLAYAALNFIRHEDISPQSPMAYYTFARTAKILYRIGAAVELKRLGYSKVKVDAGNLN